MLGRKGRLRAAHNMPVALTEGPVSKRMNALEAGFGRKRHGVWRHGTFLLESSMRIKSIMTTAHFNSFGSTPCIKMQSYPHVPT